MMDRRKHWQQIYRSKAERDVSWFEDVPAVSLRLMEAAGLTTDTCVLDVGGGDSHLVDELLSRGLDCLAVLDVSVDALNRAKARVATAATVPIWIAADVTGAWTVKPMDIWHDRAVFHFLTAPDDRARYVGHLRDVLKRRGTAIIATFALDGPDRCSGLPVVRYAPDALAAELGDDFDLVESVPHVHQTPWGTAQSFQYSRFVRTA